MKKSVGTDKRNADEEREINEIVKEGVLNKKGEGGLRQCYHVIPPTILSTW